jgi:hypothetical protein
MAKKKEDERTWAMLCHLSAFSMFVIPFGNIIGPLVFWLIKKEEYKLVADQGKESLNFQISMTLYLMIAGIFSLILVGIPFLIGLAIFDIVAIILAAVEANKGKKYRYPLSIKFIK